MSKMNVGQGQIITKDGHLILYSGGCNNESKKRGQITDRLDIHIRQTY